MPLASGIYTAGAASGIGSVIFRGVVAGICLLPPTMLMGATLPAISRWVKATPEGVSWLGYFYGGNIPGGGPGNGGGGVFLLGLPDRGFPPLLRGPNHLFLGPDPAPPSRPQAVLAGI